MRQSLVPLKIETNGKQGLLSHLSSLTRLRRRSTSANDSERSGAIRTRAETAREKGRANRGSVHVSERPYFRGKIAYAAAFARPARGTSGVFVITPTRGLVDPKKRIHLDDLREFATVDIHEDDSRYRLPIERDAQLLARRLPVESEVILLGSIATGKYVDVLMTIFRDRLRFPSEFIGRGDMSRGGLMLRCATDRQELSYVAVAGAVVNGKRPPKLAPRSYAGAGPAMSPQ